MNMFDQETSELNEVDVSEAAITRHLKHRGLELERIVLGLTNLRDDGLITYKLELRAPSKKSTEWLCIIKALGPDGAQIAFNSGGSMFSTLIGVGRRMQGGVLEWHEDSYPPDDFPERLAYLTKNATWILY